MLQRPDLPKYNIVVTKTAQGDADYVQIMSEDMFSTNIVLIGSEIEVRDERTPKAQTKKAKAKRAKKKGKKS